MPAPSAVGDDKGQRYKLPPARAGRGGSMPHRPALPHSQANVPRRPSPTSEGTKARTRKRGAGAPPARVACEHDNTTAAAHDRRREACVGRGTSDEAKRKRIFPCPQPLGRASGTAQAERRRSDATTQRRRRRPRYPSQQTTTACVARWAAACAPPPQPRPRAGAAKRQRSRPPPEAERRGTPRQRAGARNGAAGEAAAGRRSRPRSAWGGGRPRAARSGTRGAKSARTADAKRRPQPPRRDERKGSRD